MTDAPHVAPTPPAHHPVWLAPSDVRAWLDLNGQPGATDEQVDRVAAMTEPYVERCRPEFQVVGDDGTASYQPDAETYQGAVMYAAREYRRRNSPSGIQVFGEAGVSFVTRYDTDIERALRTGAYTPPGVG